SFDDWGTIPLTPISVSFSPMEDSVRSSILSQLKSLNMSMSMMEMILLPLGNFTSFIDIMNSMLGNLSYALETTGNQTIMISDLLKTIGSQLGYAASQLSDAISIFSKAMEDISKVDFQRIRQVLESYRETAPAVLNSTLRVIAEAENDLLEIRGLLMDLRNSLTDPDQIELVDNAIARIDNLYNGLKNFENQLRTAGSQIDLLFNSIESFINMLEEYQSKALGISSGLSAGVSALSQVSSALSEVSSALRLIGEANIMMGGNITSIMPILENASSNLNSVKEGLEKNMTSLKRAYDELSTFLRLINYSENRMRLMAPDAGYDDTLLFRPILSEYDGLTRLEELLFENETRIGVRTIKVFYKGGFQGLMLNDSRVVEGLQELGIEVSGDVITISQFRFHNGGNILTLWNGQEFSLLFSNNSQVVVEVDCSISEDLGERSEALSYSIIQPTLGKGLNIVVKPGEETLPLKTGLNIVMILLIVASIVAIIVLVYAFRRKREVIVI
ncbi:MAG: LPXTG cell wall anchor domain-containing protein, partial [Thermoproteota archaeon]